MSEGERVEGLRKVLDAMNTNKKRSRTFNQIAQLYDMARPHYPAELMADLLELAQLSPTAQILEIGTGTGKATLPMARRGFNLHCLEPGNNLAAVAAENLRPYPNATIKTSTFEDWPLQTEVYDLVMSAQAFHWVDPAVGYAKAAQALKPTGNIALIWNIASKSDDAIFQQLDQIFITYAEWRIRPFEELQKEREQELIASECFAEPIVKRYPWSLQYTTQQYLDLVRTQSDYLIQPEVKQRELLDAIATILENNGGGILRPYVSVLLVAQKTYLATVDPRRTGSEFSRMGCSASQNRRFLGR